MNRRQFFRFWGGAVGGSMAAAAGAAEALSDAALKAANPMFIARFGPEGIGHLQGEIVSALSVDPPIVDIEHRAWRMSDVAWRKG